jgi:hypothetical protein
MRPEGSLLSPLNYGLNPVHTSMLCSFNIHLKMLSTHICLGLASDFPIHDFQLKCRKDGAHLVSPMHATYTARLVLHDLTTLIMSGEEYQS